MSISIEAVVAAFPEADRRSRRTKELANLLVGLAAAANRRERLEALVALTRYLVISDRKVPLPSGVAEGGAPGEHRRLMAALELIERVQGLQPAVARAIAAILDETEGVPLFAQTGLPNDRGIYNETSDRLFRRILPSPRDEHDLSRLLYRLFPSEKELGWLEGLTPDLFLRLVEVVSGDEGGGTQRVTWDKLIAAIGDAFVLIAARVQGLGLSEGIRARSTPGALRESPFFLLPRAGDLVLARLADPGPRLEAERIFRNAIEGCRRELVVVLNKLESTGISVDVVYALEVIEQCLVRLERLLDVLVAAQGPERVAAGARLLGVLARLRLSDRSLRELARSNLRLLARKLIERAGKTGEHYITSSRREYWHMLASASGGGILTAGTAAMKLQIGVWHLPLFIEGLAAGANYALSFILMQVFGLTLATKQPSMTGAALAGTIRETAGPRRLEDLVTQVARICRSQLAAATANVVLVSLGALGLNYLWLSRTGVHFLGEEKAAKVLASLDPLGSGTIFFAIVTGVILWASSLVGGWAENFAVYRRLPQAIAEHPLGRYVGEKTMRRIADFFARNVSGYAGSIALGFMLGMTPSLGAAFGLPLDVRHVTLHMGALVLSASTKGMMAFQDPVVHRAAAGIAVVFVLNLSTSFFLALAVAMRAREVPLRDRLALLSAIGRRFLRGPREFLLPPRADDPAAVPAHGH